MIDAQLYFDTIIHENLKRVCLPYGLEIFDVSRWLSAISLKDDSPLELVVGGGRSVIERPDVVNVYNAAINSCLGYSLEDSYLIYRHNLSLFYFDRYERFTFFAAEEELVRQLYPFETSIIWENFYLKQDADVGDDVKEIFFSVNQI